MFVPNLNLTKDFNIEMMQKKREKLLLIENQKTKTMRRISKVKPYSYSMKK